MTKLAVPLGNKGLLSVAMSCEFAAGSWPSKMALEASLCLLDLDADDDSTDADPPAADAVDRLLATLRD